MSGSNGFDALARRLATSAHTRRGTLGAAGAGLLAAAMAGRAPRAAAQATPVATPTADPAATLDLDPLTLRQIAQALWLPAATFDELPAEVRAAISAPRNSNAAGGERIRYYLRNLLDYPDSFTPDYSQRYRTLLDYADSLSPHQAYVYTGFLGADKTRGFDELTAPADLQFPAAHAMHLGTQVEWYFAVGSAWDTAGQEYGIELMFFRYALLPPAIAGQLGLTDTENQVVELQLAISVAGDRHYQATPLVVAGTTGLLRFAEGEIGAALGRNVFAQASSDATFPLRITGRGWDESEASPLMLGLDLTFATGRDELLQGVDGCAPCCGGIGTQYYSIPNLELDPTASTIWLGDKEITLARGAFWFDHQWGNGLGGGNPRSDVLRAATLLSPSALSGWDWFMAQFTDNQQVTLAALHTEANEAFYFQTGPTAPGVMVAPAVGKLMDAAGTVTDVSGTLTVDQWIRADDTPNPALFWPTYTWYPNHWRFDLADAPAAVASFSMTPIVTTGQSAFFANGAQYSEGAVVLHDASGAEVGRGFAESVNYADTTLNKLALAGMPVTVELATVMGPVAPGLGLEAEAAIYAATHETELKAALGMCIGLG